MYSLSKDRTKRQLNPRYGIALLTWCTGLMLYVLFLMFTGDDYLNVSQPREFEHDIAILLLLLLALALSAFVWKKLFKQFREDKTKLGFTSDQTVGALLRDIIFEMILLIPFAIFG